MELNRIDDMTERLTSALKNVSLGGADEAAVGDVSTDINIFNVSSVTYMFLYMNGFHIYSYMNGLHRLQMCSL